MECKIILPREQKLALETMTKELQTDSLMTDGTIQRILYKYTYFKGYLELLTYWA